jgi:hypothetical protein
MVSIKALLQALMQVKPHHSGLPLHVVAELNIIERGPREGGLVAHQPGPTSCSNLPLLWQELRLRRWGRDSRGLGNPQAPSSSPKSLAVPTRLVPPPRCAAARPA